jgi:hypothetical protein
MIRTRFVQGRIDLNNLTPALLTSVSKALATLDAAACAGAIDWENTSKPPRKTRSDVRAPGERRRQPQESAILQDLCICFHEAPEQMWTSADVLAPKLSMPVASAKIRLKQLYDEGLIQRRLVPRQPHHRGKQRLEYAWINLSNKRVDRQIEPT